VVEQFKAPGATPVGDTPEQGATYLPQDLEKWRAVVQKAGVQIN
jgi:hypothetical protein